MVLTTAGTAYAQAVIEVIQTLNREYCPRVDPPSAVTGARR